MISSSSCEATFLFVGSWCLAGAVRFFLQPKRILYVTPPEKPLPTIERSQRSKLRQKYSPKKIPNDIDTIIIGSGMSGLSAAAILARLGKRVLVLEQHEDVAGGGTHQFDLQGFRFDSGLHYTVPWSVPIFALTCGKRPEAVTPFALMGDKNDVVDRICLTEQGSGRLQLLFDMQNGEKHLERLYAAFPSERRSIDRFLELSNRAMMFVKLFMFARLLPRWLQDIYWNLVPRKYSEVAEVTAADLLPRITSNPQLIALLSSMWIDTGARPDTASFMLTASVFRGVTMEGGCYPSMGSEALAMELANTIEEAGGTILIRAKVEKILLGEDGAVRGVRMCDGTDISARRVVSSCGLANTARRLLAPEHAKRAFGLPPDLSLPVPQSAGFVMANIGFNAAPEEAGVTNTNIWHIPVTPEGDALAPLSQYFSSPLSSDIPAFITFPGIKDRAWQVAHPRRLSCQVLMMAPYEWFAAFADSKDDNSEYAALKHRWGQRALSLVCAQYPLLRDRCELIDVSTPLSIQHYLATERGGAVGIDVTPKRFTDSSVRRQLDCVTDIAGLYMTGQDTLICGVTLCQLAGVITALRMEGVGAALRILWQSISA